MSFFRKKAKHGANTLPPSMTNRSDIEEKLTRHCADERREYEAIGSLVEDFVAAVDGVSRWARGVSRIPGDAIIGHHLEPISVPSTFDLRTGYWWSSNRHGPGDIYTALISVDGDWEFLVPYLYRMEYEPEETPYQAAVWVLSKAKSAPFHLFTVSSSADGHCWFEEHAEYIMRKTPELYHKEGTPKDWPISRVHSLFVDLTKSVIDDQYPELVGNWSPTAPAEYPRTPI